MIEHEQTQLLVRAQPPEPVVSDEKGRWLAHSWTKCFLFLLGDALALLLARATAGALVSALLHVPQNGLGSVGNWLLFFPFFAGTLYLFGGYGRIELRRPERELELSLKASSFAFFGLLVTNSGLMKGLASSWSLIVAWYFFALLFVLVTRFLLRSLYGSLWRKGLYRIRTLLIASPDKIRYYQQQLFVQRHYAYDMVGVISPNGYNSRDYHSTGVPVLGDLTDLRETIRRSNVQLVILAPSMSAEADIVARRVMGACHDPHCRVDVLVDIPSTCAADYELDQFTGCFCVSPTPKWIVAMHRLVKRVIDIGFGVLGSLVTLVIMPIVALLLKLEDGGKVFYRRDYKDGAGEPAHYYKFRTMVHDADQILKDNRNLKDDFLRNHKLRDDPRVLRVGRFLRRYSIDEFPQFFSLLTGTLTLVGPRAIGCDEKGRYGEFLPKLLSVKPGITGYWQVTGRQTTTYDDRVQMDMFYIDHWSIWLDLIIIVKTFGRLVWPEGAY